MIDQPKYNNMRREVQPKFDPKSRHYDVGGIEVQEIIRAKLTPEQYEGFCLGNIIKYACRANHKGHFDRDMEKVGFYQRFLRGAYTERMNRRNRVPDNEPQPDPESPAETLVKSLYCRPPRAGFCTDPEEI